MPNPHETRARARKAHKLCRALEMLGRRSGYDLTTKAGYQQLIGFAGAMSAHQWRELAVSAGQRPPSSETITVVVELLQDARDVAEEDPFARSEATDRHYRGARSWARDRRAAGAQPKAELGRAG